MLIKKSFLIILICISGLTINLYSGDGRLRDRYKNWYKGGCIFIGSDRFNNNLNNNFTNDFKFGANIDLYYKSVLFQFNGDFGMNKVKQDIFFDNNVTWNKDKHAEILDLGLNLGYKLINNDIITTVPTIGISTFSLTRKESESNKNDIESNLYFQPRLNFGFFTDIKPLTLIEDYYRDGDIDVQYSSVRISFGYSIPLSHPKYDCYNGSFFYITIGMGGLFRGLID